MLNSQVSLLSPKINESKLTVTLVLSENKLIK